jgi:hypothetical protein
MQSLEEELCILMLRLTFGGTPCPFEWYIFFKSIRDLADPILHNNDWGPSSLHAACQHLVPPMQLLDDDIPFTEGREQVVNIPINPWGTSDVYINNFIQATVHIENTDNYFRCACYTATNRVLFTP